jgi:thiol-disulfide isomerase/thioredoxin
MKIFQRIAVACLFAGIGAWAHPADPTTMSEAQYRESFGVPADMKIQYQDERGKALSHDEFVTRMKKGMSCALIKDPAKHTFTMKLVNPGDIAVAKPVTSLPPLDFHDIAGRPVSNKTLAGKPTLLSFFFAECVPCIKEVPILNAFRRKHPEYNYLAVTFDAPEVALEFTTQRKLEWPVAADTREWQKRAGIKTYPTYVMLSETGAVLGSGTGLDTDAMKDPVVGLATFEKWAKDTRAGGGANPLWTSLLDPKLSNFDVYLSYRGDQIMGVIKGTAPPTLKPVGLNPPGQTVFTTVQQDGKPVLRISGEIYGCLVTKQSYSNYRFRAQTRWGEKKWEPRLNELKDSGLLYHTRGPFGVDYWKSWALSQEFQVIEHGIGEFWTQATSAIDIRANPKAVGEEAPRWNPKAPWMVFVPPNNHALAGSDEDKPGEWNQIELVCYGANCVHIVNGKVVMALANSRYKDGDTFKPLDSGKLQIQSEAAEVFWRDLEIQPIAAMPAEYADYFK